MEADVVIVGAGLSGMIAARRLLDAGLDAAGPGGRRARRRADPHPGGDARGARRTRRPVDRRHPRADVPAGRRTRRRDLPAVRRGRDVLRAGRLRCAARRTSFTPDSPIELAQLERCCAVSTSWPPRFRSRLRGWHRGPPSGTPSPRVPGTTHRGFRPWPAPCWRSARSGSWRCRPSRCPSCICCSPSRPAA